MRVCVFEMTESGEVKLARLFLTVSNQNIMQIKICTQANFWSKNLYWSKFVLASKILIPFIIPPAAIFPAIFPKCIIQVFTYDFAESIS